MTITETAPAQSEAVTNVRQQAQPSRLRIRVLQGAALVALLVLYATIVAAVPQVGRVLPTLPEAGAAAVDLAVSPEFWMALIETLLAVLQAFAICLVGGIAVGLIVALVPGADASSRFVIDFVRTIPPLALIPLGLLLIGPNMRMEVALISFTAIWPIVIQTHRAVMGIERQLLETARVYRVPSALRVGAVIIPAMAPALFAGIRLTATLCLILAIGTELLARSSGLGSLIRFTQQAGQHAESLVLVLVTGVLGVLLNGMLTLPERKLLAWSTEAAR
ncbi:ABC transporter permease [Agromyces bauzanensis]